MPKVSAAALAAAALVATQEEPTRPRPTDDFGRELDEWGLPLSGPARVRALALAGKADPRIDPDGWAETVDEPLETMSVEAPADPVVDPAPTPTEPPVDPAPITED